MSNPAHLGEYTFAYQPIVDTNLREIASYEALVRGPGNEPAGWVFDQLAPGEFHCFDMEARQRALILAAELGLSCHINLNLQPNTLEIFGPRAVESTLELAATCGIPMKRLVIEVSETESVVNCNQFVQTINHWRAQGVQFAIDDFGAGYSNLNLLADFQPESVKLDMVLVRNIWHRGPRQAIIRGVARTCEDLGIDIVAEGVETVEEFEWLRDEGISLFQGYFFGRPGFRALPSATFP